jgi:uncharacterized membrane protein
VEIKLKAENNKTLLTIGAIIAILIITISLISTFWPRYEMQFIELGLLGKDKVAKDYFSNENSTVSLGTQVSWYIYIHNHVEGSQTVIIKIKLVNSTMQIPNDEEHIPSPSASFIELSVPLLDNETLMVPFSWSITEIASQGDLIFLRQLIVNNQSVNLDVSTFSNSFFQMIFELWVYNQSSQEYEFGWQSSQGLSSASLHIGFRVPESLSDY